MEFPSYSHLAKGHLYNCSVPSSWANLQSCAWEGWNTPLKQKSSCLLLLLFFQFFANTLVNVFRVWTQFIVLVTGINWKSNMLKSIYNTSQSYSISVSRKELFPTTLRVRQIFCLSKTLKAAHYISTVLQLTAPDISFPQPRLLLKSSQPHTRALASGTEQDQDISSAGQSSPLYTAPSRKQQAKANLRCSPLWKELTAESPGSCLISDTCLLHSVSEPPEL